MCLAALACLCAVLPAPASAKAGLRKAFWGPLQIDGGSAFPTYQLLGVKTYQIQIDWPDVASSRPANPTDPADPAYKWPGKVDNAITQAGASGMDVMVQILFTPSWANGGKDPAWAPTDPADAAAFFTAAARRYPTVRRWMVWGEPNDFVHWNPAPPHEIWTALHGSDADGPHLYAQVLDAVYVALKAVSRSNVVIGGNSWTAGTIHPFLWVKNLKLPNGKPPRMDMYGHNPFSVRRPSLSNPPSREGRADFSDLDRLGQAVDKYLGRGRRHIPLWLSEWTIPTAPGSEFNYWVSEATQAAWVRAGMRIARKSRYVGGVGWIHLRDDGPNEHNGFAGSRITEGLQRYDGTPKPAFAVFQHG
jgi:hypothetical protein